jgi:hypothetical protein
MAFDQNIDIFSDTVIKLPRAGVQSPRGPGFRVSDHKTSILGSGGLSWIWSDGLIFFKVNSSKCNSPSLFSASK